MSKWLKSVNNLLDKIDDGIQTDAAAFTERLRGLGNRRNELDESSYEDEEYSEDDEDDASEDFDDESGIPISARSEGVMGEGSFDAGDAGEIAGSNLQLEQMETTIIDAPRTEGDIRDSEQDSSTSVASQSQANSPTLDPAQAPAAPPPKKMTADVKPVIPSPPSSTATNSTAPAAKSKRELKKALQDNQHLLRLNVGLREQLDQARAELNAQQDELESAAARMKQDRLQMKQEREELLDEQEEELQQLRDHYDALLAEQKEHYENELEDSRDRMQRSEQIHLAEGGDMTMELEGALQREREALKELSEVKSERSNIESDLLKLETQQQELQAKVVSLTATAREAADRERAVEEKLDLVMSQHKRQLNQKQERESELEKTIAELGNALTIAEQRKHLPASNAVPVGENTAEVSYMEKYMATAEELDAVKAEVSLRCQQRDVLQNELHDMSRDHDAEIALFQDRQRQQDERMNELTAHVSRLEASLREQNTDPETRDRVATIADNSSSFRIEQLSRELDQARRQLSLRTDQYHRQKNLVDSQKTEMLTLKGRLDAATLRADQADAQMPDLGGGGVAYSAARARRRVKGGGRYSQLPSRSLLSALGMHVARGSLAEQVAITIDAIDTWMMETGNILRHEPMARLGFAFYLIMVHLWCACLVFFHAVQSEHGDLSSLTAPRGKGLK
jgi:hypothetical protein